MPQPKPLPPLATLRQVLSYDPETGALTWLVDPKNQRRAGSVAGSQDEQGYVQVHLSGRRLKAHRVAWCLHHGTDPGPLLVDHINRDRSDNRICNLRLVDAKGNRANSAQPLRPPRANPSQPLRRPVQVIYPDGQNRLFPSRVAAAAALGCHPKSIYRYAKGLCPHPAGLIVSYA
jgi:hypothetical protein